jgi:hypothetical protein
MNQATQIAPHAWYQPSVPQRDRAYLRWIKLFNCIVCGSAKQVDAAHCGPHGLGQKASDYNALPMCRVCHEGFDGGPVGFAERHSLAVPESIQFFNHLWFLKTGKSIERAA